MSKYVKQRPDKYVLDGHATVPWDDLLAWGRWFETADRRVALTEHELFRVSTVFLGLDHQFGPGPPLLFETMAFERGSSSEIECRRYANWEDAELGHKAMVNRLLKTAREAGNVR